MGSESNINTSLRVDGAELEKSPVESLPTSLEPLKDEYGARPAVFKSTIQEILFVLTATMAIGMSSMSAGSVTVITAFVGRELNMSTAQITWISASTSLAGGSFLLFFARIADLFGRRTMFVGSLLLFALFSLGAGFAKTPLTLDVLCGFMGLMSAAAVPPAQGMLGVIYDKPSKRKNAVFACFSAGNPLGFVFGIIASGIATQVLGWRASFWWLALVYLIFSVMAFFIVPNDTAEKERLNWEALKRFDIPGVILTIAGTGTFSAALTLGADAPKGWKTAYVLALLVVGIACLIAFVFWELWVKYPLIPMGIFKDRNFSLLLAVLLLGFIAFPTSSFWLSLYIQRVWKASPLKTAVYLLPMAIAGMAVNIIAAVILHRVSNKLLMGVGAIAYTLSFLFEALNRTGYSYWAMIFPALCLGVVGADFQFNVTNMYVMSTLSRAQQSIAGGLFQTVTRLCITIGMGISTAIFSEEVKKGLDAPGFHKGDPVRPYSAVFWFCTAAAGASCFLVPFLTLGTQGQREKDGKKERKEESQEKK